MHARFLPFSARLRRYHHFARQVNRQLQDGSFRLLKLAEQKKMLHQLKQRFNKLRKLLPEARLKAGLASIALLAASLSASAQSFGPPQPNQFGLLPEFTEGYPIFADVDGDGDMDILAASSDYDTGDPLIYFLENTGTAQAPSFAADAAEINPFGIEPNGFMSSLDMVDLDDDGDLDLLAGWLYTGGFQFFENTGSATNPAFASPDINPFGLTISGIVGFPSFADLDNDGDADLLIGTYGEGLQYYQNTGTPSSPDFAAPVTNPFGLSTASSEIQVPVFNDLDNDGDLDLLFFGYSDFVSALFFAENTGTPEAPAFAPPVDSPFGINTQGIDVAIPCLVDIDGDGDTDLFVNDYQYGTMYFYKNNEVDIPVAPSASDNTVTMQEDGVYQFAPADFQYLDGNGDPLQAVEITSLPTDGSLKLGTVAVTVGQVVAVADIPNLLFDSGLNDFGSPYASFGFRVNDGMFWSNDSYTIYIDVTAVNDAPVTSDGLVLTYKNTDYEFDVADFPFTDIESTALGGVKITQLPAKGSLKINGVAVIAGQVIAASQINTGLTYAPAAGEFGVAYTSFGFQVYDGLSFSGSATLVIDVEEFNAAHDQQLQASVGLSPNPVADLLHLSVKASQHLDQPSLTVYDERGRAVHHETLLGQYTAFDQEVDVSRYAAGTYYVVVRAGQQASAALPFVVQ